MSIRAKWKEADVLGLQVAKLERFLLLIVVGDITRGTLSSIKIHH
jgi:hypothetical protein